MKLAIRASRSDGLMIRGSDVHVLLIGDDGRVAADLTEKLPIKSVKWSVASASSRATVELGLDGAEIDVDANLHDLVVKRVP